MQQAGGVVEVSGEQHLLKELSQARRALAMVYADWCGACKSIKPMVHQEAPQHVDVVLLVNEAEPMNKPILRQLDVEAFPTFVLKPGHGKPHQKWTGANPEQLRARLQQ
jgi:thiol:disulfide interchange protein